MKRTFFCFLMICILIAGSTAQAVTLSSGQISSDVRSLQFRLSELNYYTDGITGEFDMATQVAVDLFRRDNGMFISDGIDDNTWNAIFDANAKTCPTADALPPLYPGSTCDAVVDLQSHLLALGYYHEEFVAGVYDEATQLAQNRYCRDHLIQLQSGANPALQRLILSEPISQKQDEAASSSNVQSTLKNFMLAPVIIGRYAVPAGVFYAIMLLLTVIVIALLIMIKQKRNSILVSSKEQNNSDMHTKHVLEAKVIYAGNERKLSFPVDARIAIGREDDGIKLDSKDRNASRHHCQVFYKGTKLYLVDTSSDGTYVNNTRIHHQEKEIQLGDVIRAGSHTFQFFMR